MKFLLKIFSPSLLFFSIFLIIYTFYRSYFFWNNEKNNYYIVYSLISFSFFIISVSTFFFNKKIKEYFIIFFISTFASLFLFEIFLNFRLQINKEQIYENDTGKKYDSRSIIEIFEELRKTNKNIKVKVGPFNNFLDKNYNIFPLSGVSKSKTIFCNENGYYAIYDSDRYGFNNPDQEWNQSEIEYLIIGDSFAHGACVNSPNDIASVIRDISKKSVLNLGYNGNGPLIEYATLREYLHPNVKKILWFYFEGNDLQNLNIELKNEFLVKYLDDVNFSQKLRLKQNIVDKLANNKIEYNRELELEKLKKNKELQNIANKNIHKESMKTILIKFIKLTKIRRALIGEQTKREIQPKPQEEFIKILKLVKDLSYKNNSQLYFIYLPEYWRYKLKNNDENINVIKDIVESLDINFIDIHSEVFEKEKNPLELFPFKGRGHYNVKGYKKIAERLAQL